MMINEPITLATDYMLTTASTIFGVLLWRMSSRAGARDPGGGEAGLPTPPDSSLSLGMTARLWALAFFFTACGSFFGGTFHGFGGAALWKATVYSIGLASMFLFIGATQNRVLRGIAIALFAIYAIWMIAHDDFVYVIVDYGISLIAITILQIAAWIRDRAASAPWVIGSVIVSVVAAIVQQAPITYHNDIYHLIQLVALWLLYRGGTLMSSATERPTIQPT